MLDEEIDAKEQHMTDFVPKPLYTRNELQSFRRKNTVDGIFVATEETVQSVEDLEKLLFLRKRRRSVLRKIQCRWMARYGVRTD